MMATRAREKTGHKASATPRKAALRLEHGRTCVGCTAGEPTEAVRRADGSLLEAEGANAHDGASAPQRGPLVRLVVGPKMPAPATGKNEKSDETVVELAVDTGETDFGRGAYVHAAPSCIEAAAQRGLARAVRSLPVLDGAPVTARSLSGAIVEAYDRRLASLIGAAARSRRLEVGADAVKQALGRDPSKRDAAQLCVVALDAQAAADSSEVRRAVAEGRAIAWGSKAELARIVRGVASDTGVGIVAVTDGRIALALRETSILVEALRGVSTSKASPRRAGVPGVGKPSSSNEDAGDQGAGSPRASTLAEGADTLRDPNGPLDRVRGAQDSSLETPE